MDQHRQFQALAYRIDPSSRLVRTWSLTGGVSAETTGFEIELGSGRRQKLLARRHGGADLRHNPDIARHEFKLVRIARSHGLLAPEPWYVDDRCDIFPTPVIVVEFVEGETVFAPANQTDYVAQAADQLARIHGVPAAPELSFLPDLGTGFGERPQALDHSLSEEQIRDTLEANVPVSRLNPSSLLHGDYWPGNLLWRDGRLVAVIDWEDARVGDPLADVANARLEILFAVGIDAMHAFTRQYQSVTALDFTNLPYWDLCAALKPCSRISGWGLDELTERTMRGHHRLFINQAFEELGD